MQKKFQRDGIQALLEQTDAEKAHFLRGLEHGRKRRGCDRSTGHEYLHEPASQLVY